MTKLDLMVDSVGSFSRFQRKALNRIVENSGEEFKHFAEDLIGRLEHVAAEHGKDITFVAEAYHNYTKEIKAEELYFAKNQRYRESDFAEVYEKVYGQEAYMLHYVLALGMTQAFWANHYQIVRFYLDEFLPRISAARSGAEVGVGHGLFHAEMLKAAMKMESLMLDISPISLSVCGAMIEATGLDRNRAKPIICDIQKDVPIEDRSLDVLLLGEIVEHIENGAKLLSTLAMRMCPNGLCFFTTAANAPAPDHILLFRSVSEIRTLIEENGWSIRAESIGTLGDMPVEDAEKNGQNINYAAILDVK